MSQGLLNAEITLKRRRCTIYRLPDWSYWSYCASAFELKVPTRQTGKSITIEVSESFPHLRSSRTLISPTPLVASNPARILPTPLATLEFRSLGLCLIIDGGRPAVVSYHTKCGSAGTVGLRCGRVAKSLGFFRERASRLMCHNSNLECTTVPPQAWLSHAAAYPSMREILIQ